MCACHEAIGYAQPCAQVASVTTLSTLRPLPVHKFREAEIRAPPRPTTVRFSWTLLLAETAPWSEIRRTRKATRNVLNTIRAGKFGRTYIPSQLQHTVSHLPLSQ